MGANCSKCFIDKEEAEQWISEQTKSAFESCLNPVGDAVILDIRDDKMYFFEVEIDDNNVGLREKTSGISFPNILACVVGRYGEKPTKEKPFLAMVRFD